MKRGLKAAAGDENFHVNCVATFAPMKRGLKAAFAASNESHSKCSNLCPDEKGTESRAVFLKVHVGVVATFAPMKRGLKAMQRKPEHYEKVR